MQNIATTILRYFIYLRALFDLIITANSRRIAIKWKMRYNLIYCTNIPFVRFDLVSVRSLCFSSIIYLPFAG